MIHVAIPNIRISTPGFTATDLLLPFSTANVVDIHLLVRYPPGEEFVAINRESAMIARVMKGRAALISVRGRTVLSEGDVVLIPKNVWYSWQPMFEAQLFIFSTPSWTKLQEEFIPIKNLA